MDTNWSGQMVRTRVSQGAHKTPHNYNLTDLSSRKCKWLSNNWIYPFHSQEWQNSDFSLQYKKGGEERENIDWGNIVQISIQNYYSENDEQCSVDSAENWYFDLENEKVFFQLAEKGLQVL